MECEVGAMIVRDNRNLPDSRNFHRSINNCSSCSSDLGARVVDVAGVEIDQPVGRHSFHFGAAQVHDAAMWDIAFAHHWVHEITHIIILSRPAKYIGVEFFACFWVGAVALKPCCYVVFHFVFPD